MKQSMKWYIRICGFSALWAITVQNFALKAIISVNFPTLISFFAPFLAGTVAYVLLYKLLVGFYELKAWKWLLKSYNIDGIWYHEYRSKTDPKYIRRGVTHIKQDVWDINFDGRNYDTDLNVSSRTMWHDTAVDLQDQGRLVVAYIAHRHDEASPEDPNIGKEGVLHIQIIKDDKRRPCRLIGIFQDSWPSKRRGVLTWLRKTEWSDEFEEKGL